MRLIFMFLDAMDVGRKLCIASVVIFFLTGCNSDNSDTNYSLTEKALQTGTKIGFLTKLSDLARLTGEFACVLHPYQEKISEKYPESRMINKGLEINKYQATEDQWALVVLENDELKISRFKRSKHLDLASSGLISSALVSFPEDFEMADCISFNKAGFLKISINNRIYLVFGGGK